MPAKILRIAVWILLWVFLVIAAVCTEAYWSARSIKRGSIHSIENHLQNKLHLAISNHKLGCAALILINDGKIHSETGFGIANLETGNPVKTEQTLFMVASVSKAVTAWGVMKLVEEGKIGLDEPVIRYLKRWRFPGSKAYRDKVTIRHLLSHTAGLDDSFGYVGFASVEQAQSLEESLTLTRDVSSGEPRGVIITREPGSSFAYSGAGFTVLQLLIEDVTNMSFDDYMKKTVLQPLKMLNSGFDLRAADSAGRAQDIASAYDHVLKPQPHRVHAAKASVSLYATPKDLARFVLAYLSGNPVLKQETLRQMMISQPGTSGTWGLGQALFANNASGVNLVGHDGGTYPAWGAWIRVNPASGNGIVIMVSGGKGAVNQLIHDWTFWETGKVTWDSWLQRVFDRVRLASIAIFSGIIAIVLWNILRRNSFAKLDIT